MNLTLKVWRQPETVPVKGAFQKLKGGEDISSEMSFLK
jgi:hypothetical protein